MVLLRSWVESANEPEGEFPLNNLPFGVAAFDGRDPVCCTAIGDQVLNLASLEEAGLFELAGDGVFRRGELNRFMELGSDAWNMVRDRLTDLLREGGDDGLSSNSDLTTKAMHHFHEATMHLPFRVAEFTDFYAGRNHAENVGTLLRGKENALPPNWLHIPIGYNGRASTVVVSGTDITRPMGQLKNPEFEAPIFAHGRRLDIELEMGAVVGKPGQMGDRVSGHAKFVILPLCCSPTTPAPVAPRGWETFSALAQSPVLNRVRWVHCSK